MTVHIKLATKAQAKTPYTAAERTSPLYTPNAAAKAALAKSLGRDLDGAFRVKNRLDASQDKAAA